MGPPSIPAPQTTPIQPPAPGDMKIAVACLRAALRQLGQVLTALSDEAYNRRPIAALDSSVGGHVRHSLDHVIALLAAVDTGELLYDRRERGTLVECDRAAALTLLSRLERDAGALAHHRGDRALRLHTIISGDGCELSAGTTLAREVAFVLSHTVHHNALLAVLLDALGVAPPERFGYAPSTIAYLNDQADHPASDAPAAPTHA